MAKENWLPAADVQTFPAAGDLSAKQFYLMEMDTSGEVDAADATTDLCVGVLLNDPSEQGQEAEVMIGVGKTVKLVASAAISIGDKVGVTSTGKGVTVTAGKYHGVARDAATADGEIIGLFFTGPIDIGVD